MIAASGRAAKLNCVAGLKSSNHSTVLNSSGAVTNGANEAPWATEAPAMAAPSAPSEGTATTTTEG